MLGLVWILAVVVVTAQTTADNTNTFEIFRTAAHNLLAGADLYGANATHHDYFDYPPSFALLFAPLAFLPVWLAVLLWNALNAGTLYWSLGRILAPRQAFMARTIVFLDTVGSIQNRQSNALCAALLILAFSELERARELRAALMIAVGAAIKVFPLAAVAFALFRPASVARFAIWGLIFGALVLAAPVLFLTPVELVDQYRTWFARQPALASVEYSVMDQLRIWFGVRWPYWPLQLLGVIALVAPFGRSVARVASESSFRLLGLASVLMFCVLFNHKAESPTFVIALAGVGIWFAVSARDRVAWTVLGIVFVGTVLAPSEAMPRVLQERLFEPYRLKTLPILLVWVLTQVELWRRTASAARQDLVSGLAVPAT